MKTRDALFNSIASEIQLLINEINKLRTVREFGRGGQLWTDFWRVFLSRREEKTDYTFSVKATAIANELLGSYDASKISDPISILDYEKAILAIHRVRGTENGISADIKRICNNTQVTVRGYKQDQCGWIGDITAPEFTWSVLDDAGGVIQFDRPIDAGIFGETVTESVDGGTFGGIFTDAGIVEFIFTTGATEILALLGLTRAWNNVNGGSEIGVTTEVARSVLFSGLGTLSMFGKTLEEIQAYFAFDMHVNARVTIEDNVLTYDPDNSLCYLDLDNMVTIDAINKSSRSNDEVAKIIRHDFVPIKYNTRIEVTR